VLSELNRVIEDLSGVIGKLRYTRQRGAGVLPVGVTVSSRATRR
jgi:hypothetical protein